MRFFAIFGAKTSLLPSRIARNRPISETGSLLTLPSSGESGANLIFEDESLLRSCLESLRQGRSESLYTAFLTDLAEVLAKAGRLGESLVAAAEALQRTERNDAFWWMPEALRINGEILMQSNPSDLESIEDCFTRSLACACRQGALSREIRAATTLAQLWKQRGRPAPLSRGCPSGYPAEPLVSYQINRQFSGWLLSSTGDSRLQGALPTRDVRRTSS